MSLEKYVENAWLKREPTSPQEIADQLSIVERCMKDAAFEGISDDLRFYTTFNALLALATVALRASGYRTANQIGHHARTIETLEYTIGADSKTTRKLMVFSKKRNAASYDAAGSISHEELRQILQTADELRDDVESWLKKAHPELVEVLIMHLNLLQLGRIPYTEGLRIQSEVVAARKANLIADTLILLEHPSVLTLGRNASRANILASDELLASRGAEIHEINRGGDVTYHGPGQLVGYPIFDLRGDLPGKRGPHLGPVDFVRLMEEALILTCKDFGVPTQRICKLTGVWTLAGGSVREKKIAAIGVHVSQAVTSHGFALNVTTDLRDFDWIIPCGITDRAVTSLEIESPHTPPPSISEASNNVAANFGRVFQRQIMATESLDQLLSTQSTSV